MVILCRFRAYSKKNSFTLSAIFEKIDERQSCREVGARRTKKEEVNGERSHAPPENCERSKGRERMLTCNGENFEPHSYTSFVNML